MAAVPQVLDSFTGCLPHYKWQAVRHDWKLMKNIAASPPNWLPSLTASTNRVSYKQIVSTATWTVQKFNLLRIKCRPKFIASAIINHLKCLPASNRIRKFNTNQPTILHSMKQKSVLKIRVPPSQETSLFYGTRKFIAALTTARHLFSF